MKKEKEAILTNCISGFKGLMSLLSGISLNLAPDLGIALQKEYKSVKLF